MRRARKLKIPVLYVKSEDGTFKKYGLPRLRKLVNAIRVKHGVGFEHFLYVKPRARRVVKPDPDNFDESTLFKLAKHNNVLLYYLVPYKNNPKEYVFRDGRRNFKVSFSGDKVYIGIFEYDLSDPRSFKQMKVQRDLPGSWAGTEEQRRTKQRVSDAAVLAANPRLRKMIERFNKRIQRATKK